MPAPAPTGAIARARGEEVVSEECVAVETRLLYPRREDAVTDLPQLLKEALPVAIDASAEGKGGVLALLGRTLVLLAGDRDYAIAALQPLFPEQPADLVQLVRIVALSEQAHRGNAPAVSRTIEELRARVAELEATLAPILETAATWHHDDEPCLDDYPRAQAVLDAAEAAWLASERAAKAAAETGSAT